MPVVRANVAVDFGQGAMDPILHGVGSDMALLVTSNGNNRNKTINCPKPDSHCADRPQKWRWTISWRKCWLNIAITLTGCVAVAI